MKIAVFSHASGMGGAERALVNLLTLLKHQGHELTVFLPKLKGQMLAYLDAMDVAYKKYSFTSSLPNVAESFHALTQDGSKRLIADLLTISPDLIVVNTTTLLQVQLIASKFLIPCVLYSHEDLEKDFELGPSGWSAGFYNKVSALAASHIVCASNHIKTAFLNKTPAVLYPFDSTNQDRRIRSINLRQMFARIQDRFQHWTTSQERVSLFVVGNKSLRKNVVFAVAVVKALQLRCIDCELYIIGTKGECDRMLKSQVRIKKPKYVYIYDQLVDPYALGGTLKINLICSTSEPFGLTLTECMARNIPSVASRSGGPSEVLDAELLYDIGNLDQCVRRIEDVIARYPYFRNKCEKSFSHLNKINSFENRLAIVNSVLERALATGPARLPKTIETHLSKLSNVAGALIPEHIVLQHIAEVSQQSEQPATEGEIRSMMKHEVLNPGHAISFDMKRFDVVPFADSLNMALLYKNGLGLAVELAAYMNDPGKQAMLRFIHMSLIEDSEKLDHTLRVLCLGDGLGVDSIWISSLGFSVDYMDYDKSMISLCVEKNIQYFSNTFGGEHSIRVINKLTDTYDAVICLEVIEHVENPRSFLTHISSHMADQSKLFISDCFDGVIDRWPTHLYTNERYSHNIQKLAIPFLTLVDVNLNPYAKPYVFKKLSSQEYSGDQCNSFIQKK